MSAYARPRSLFALVVNGETVLEGRYVIERGRTVPRFFDGRAMKALSEVLDAVEPVLGQRTARYAVLQDGKEIISSFATRPDGAYRA